MEVLLATAILLSSVLVLMELASIGRYYVQSVESRSMAQMLCQSKLNELLAGVQPLEDVEERAVEDHPDWLYSVTMEPVGHLPLVAVRVTVTEQIPEGTNRVIRGKPKQFSLVRWVPDQGRAVSLAGGDEPDMTAETELGRAADDPLDEATPAK